MKMIYMNIRIDMWIILTSCLTIYQPISSTYQCKMSIRHGHDAADHIYATNSRYVDTQNEPIIPKPWCITHCAMNKVGYTVKDACS